MTDSVADLLKGARVLVVEDEYFLADDLAQALRAAGAVPIGPVPSLDGAEEMLAKGGIDAAILDLNLRGELAYDLAVRVCGKVPCVLVSGYASDALPPAVACFTRLEKPTAPEAVIKVLSERMAEAPKV